ncbi:MAG: protein-export chaperone SecB [Pseudomonadota bacterium]
MAEETAAASEEDVKREIGVSKIYIKDFSFESPGSPKIFATPDFRPNTNMNLRTSNTKIEDHLYEMVLTITLDAKVNDETAFLVELQQAGLFVIRGYSDEEMSLILGTFCPSTLFPYARAAVSAAVQRGGFPDLILQPIDFEALFRRSQEEAAQQLAAGAH